VGQRSRSGNRRVPAGSGCGKVEDHTSLTLAQFDGIFSRNGPKLSLKLPAPIQIAEMRHPLDRPCAACWDTFHRNWRLIYLDIVGRPRLDNLRSVPPSLGFTSRVLGAKKPAAAHDQFGAARPVILQVLGTWRSTISRLR
jgi:hypothetical protein